MELFFKGAAGLLITCVLTLVLNRQEKDLGLLLSMAACVMGLTILASFLEPVMTFLKRLQSIGDLNGELLSVLLKAVGIGILSEIAGMICTDSGNSSLGKTMQLLGAAVILWLSLPAFELLMELMTSILGDL